MTSPAVRRARRLYKTAAISNFVVTIPAFLWYRRYVDLFLPRRPNYRFLVWIWSGMAFLWGVSFLEIARDPEEALGEGDEATVEDLPLADPLGVLPLRRLLLGDHEEELAQEVEVPVLVLLREGCEVDELRHAA